jgi:hypothetical protein
LTSRANRSRPRTKNGSKSKNRASYNVRAHLVRILGIDLVDVIGISDQDVPRRKRQEERGGQVQPGGQGAHDAGEIRRGWESEPRGPERRRADLGVLYSYSKSDYFDVIPTAMVDDMIAWAERKSAPLSFAHLNHFGGAMSPVANDTIHQLSVYDAAYLELAHRRNLVLGCKDGPLREAAKQSGVGLWE